LDFDQTDTIPIIEFKDFLENRYKMEIKKLKSEDAIPLTLEMNYYLDSIEATRNIKEKEITFDDFVLFMGNIVQF